MTVTAPTESADATPLPSDSAPPRSDPAIESLTRGELARIAFRQVQTGSWITVAGVAAHLLLLRHALADAVLFAWVGYMAIPSAGSIWLARRFQASGGETTAGRRWAFFLVLASLLTGLGWGTTPCLFPQLNEPGIQRSAHLLLLAGLVIASMRVLLPLRKGAIAFVVIMMAPVALCSLRHDDPARLVLVFFVLLFVCLVLWSIVRSHRILSEAIAIRFEREALAVGLRAEITLRESRESELRDTQEQAAAAARAKDDFLASISHELRTPMNGVLGMLRILRDTELTAEQIDYVKTASNSAEVLMTLLNDVIDFAKLEADKLELECAPFSPAAAARAVAALHQPRAVDKGLQLALLLEDSLPAEVTGDTARVQHLLINLLSNAIKFTEKGRVELRVECPQRSPQGVTLHFTVTDTGIGIAPEMLERLFKPFTQADSSMSRRYGGAGLGLAISQRLAQAMGGSLEVQSVVGQGSTFRLVLPCQLPTGPAATAGSVVPKLRGQVLVVEDDAVNRQVIELFLKKLDVSVQFVDDGEAAIAAATSENFDLVLMDCHLPGLDGLEATRRIRKKLAGKPLKIIAVTAIADPQMHDACLAAGMDDYMSKPVRFEKLAAVLQQHLPAR